LPWKAFLPRDYVPGQKLRIEVYRRLGRVRRLDRLEDFKGELRDRFGPLPERAEWLLRLAELRLLAERWQVAALHLEGKGIKDTATAAIDTSLGPVDVVLGYRNPRKIKRLAERSEGRLRIVDEATAYFRLSPAETEPEALYACLKHLLRLPERPL
jgi:transcription-repair coupling factor (superfamily II helicase)